jgi:glycosyltransferase involved in cell wall biosynthesis
MRITFVAPAANLSGGIRVIAILADRLRARGHRVTVVAPRPRRPGPKDYLRALVRGRLPERPPTHTHFDGMQAELSLFDHPEPATEADVPQADAVIATWWETAFAVAALSPDRGRKFHFVQGHEVFDPLPKHLSAGSYHLPLRKIAVSGWLADEMRRHYGDADVAVVPNSVDTAQFFAAPRGRQPEPTVGLLYSTAHIKGVDAALRAVALARQRLPGLRVVAFGAEPVAPALPLPAGARYFHTPAQSRLREIYAKCDVWLGASRQDGFGLPILEAMACGCPVVATRAGCAGDVIAEGETGHVVAVDDCEALADRLVQVLSLEDARWRDMSEAARRRAASYTWDDAAELFEQALQRP